MWHYLDVAGAKETGGRNKTKKAIARASWRRQWHAKRINVAVQETLRRAKRRKVKSVFVIPLIYSTQRLKFFTPPSHALSSVSSSSKPKLGFASALLSSSESAANMGSSWSAIFLISGAI